MIGRTDLELLKEHSREELVEIATKNFIKELTRLSGLYKTFTGLEIRYLNNVISMDIKVTENGETTTKMFTKEIYQFTPEDVTSLYARLKVALKPNKIKVTLVTDKKDIAQ